MLHKRNLSNRQTTSPAHETFPLQPQDAWRKIAHLSHSRLGWSVFDRFIRPYERGPLAYANIVSSINKIVKAPTTAT